MSVRVARRMNSRVSSEDGARSWIIHSFILEELVHGVIQHRYKLIVNWLLESIHNFRDRVQDKSCFSVKGSTQISTGPDFERAALMFHSLLKFNRHIQPYSNSGLSIPKFKTSWNHN